MLTDESLLLPVLYAVPGAVDQLNITMGYPLRQTTAYSFVERLIGLQGRKRVRSGNTWFYHNDALGLLEHPYIRQGQPEIASALADGIRRSRSVYVRSGLFEVGGRSDRCSGRPVHGSRCRTIYAAAWRMSSRNRPGRDRRMPRNGASFSR